MRERKCEHNKVKKERIERVGKRTKAIVREEERLFKKN